MQQYRKLITVTAILGIAFIVMQMIGFNQMWNRGVNFNGSGAGQFLYIIFGLHALHVTRRGYGVAGHVFQSIQFQD